jgi:hypothetical protein
MHPLITVSKFNARYPYTNDDHRTRISMGLRAAAPPVGEPERTKTEE